MAVKRSKSGTRILSVLEEIAAHQPIGVSELSRLMNADKSTLQRAIMTLVDEGWVHAASGGGRRWELTGHIHLIAHMAQSSSSLRQRALPILSALRDETGETAALTVPDIGRFVVLEVVESRLLLRTAPPVGTVIMAEDSATGRAILPHLSPARQAELLDGVEIDDALRAGFAMTLAEGFAVSEDDHGIGSVNIAAPVFDANGSPTAAVLLSAPSDRLRPVDYARAGAKVLQAARELSLSRPDLVRPSLAEPVSLAT